MKHFWQISGALLLLGTVNVRAQNVTPVLQAREEGSSIFRDAVRTVDDWNWRPISYFPDLLDHPPIKVSVNQSLRYNDNVLFLSNGVLTPPNLTRGDFSSLTNVGLSSKMHIGGQTFFADGNYTFTRYRNDSALDTVNHVFNAGMDWVFTSRCSGRVIATSSLVAAPFEDTTGFTINNIKTQSLVETARCKTTGYLTAILDSGWVQTENTQLSATPNDSTRHYIRWGLEYDVTGLNTLRVTATFTDVDFPNRVAGLGLATALSQAEYELFYRRILSRNLDFEGTIGQTQITTASTSLSAPTYSAKLHWNASPILSFTVSTASGVGPPQNILADFQRIKMLGLTANYRYSPVLSFTGAVSRSTIENSTVSGVIVTPILQQSTALSASIQANYRISPLMNMSFSYQLAERKDTISGLQSTSNLYMISLSYTR